MNLDLETFALLATPGTFVGFLVVERILRARPLPRISWWRSKSVLSFVVMTLTGMYAPLLWLDFVAAHRLMNLERLGVAGGAILAFLAMQLVTYGWHRLMHKVHFLWRWFHQLHHSAERLDVYGGVYFHPLDNLAFTFIQTVTPFFILGVRAEAAIIAGMISLFYALFKHANVRTPRWLGYFIQRPESHSVHHARGVHAYNYADLPLWTSSSAPSGTPSTSKSRPAFMTALRRAFPKCSSAEMSRLASFALLFALAACAPRRAAKPPSKPMFNETTIALPSGLHLSLVDTGERSAKEALVLLPGLGDSWRSYEVILEHLRVSSPSMRTIAYSPRGHGDSDKPANGYTIEDFAKDLHELLDTLGLERVFLAGHSSASLVARRYTLDHRERVAGLILEGSFVSLRGHIPPEVEAKMTSLTDPVPKDFVRDFTAGTFSRPPPAAFVDAMVEETMKLPARVWNGHFASLASYDDARDLPTLSTPTLVLWGDKDAIIQREMTESLARSIRSSSLVVYEGIGHTPHWEAPEQFARDVSAFVAPRAR